jgi:hypothetical protein
MKVSFLLPVARASYADVIQSWLENTHNDVVEQWVISFDESFTGDQVVPEHLFDSCLTASHSIPNGDIVLVWNSLAKQATGDLIVVLADDYYCRTQDWTQYIPTVDQPRIYYGDDGIQGKRLPTHPIYTRAAYEITHYVFPPHYKAWYTDNELKSVAEAVGILEYIPEIQCEHKHWVNKKAQQDETYNKGQATAAEGKETYYQRLRNGKMQAEVQRIWEQL